jgi:hypothetical protein
MKGSASDAFAVGSNRGLDARMFEPDSQADHRDGQPPPGPSPDGRQTDGTAVAIEFSKPPRGEPC